MQFLAPSPNPLQAFFGPSVLQSHSLTMSLDTTPWHLDSRYQPTILSPNPTLLKPSRHVPTVTPLTACRPVPTRDLSHQPQYPSQYQNTIRPSPYPDPANRPSAPGRVHSFCGDSSTSTYALASASASAHLTPDKRSLVAPPLERTISSIGSRGNHSSPAQQMVRPKVVKQDVVRLSKLCERDCTDECMCRRDRRLRHNRQYR